MGHFLFGVYNLKDRRFNKHKRNTDFVPTNHQIRSPKVRCIDSEDNNLGVIDKLEAIRIAENAKLDLVQVAPGNRDNPPTCRILDSGKYKYEMSKRKKENAKKQRESAVKIKEVKFRPNTDQNDLKTKATKAQQFIEDGHRVKVSIFFRGREITHKDVGMETLNKFLQMVPNMHLLGEPVQQGKILSVIGTRKKEVELKAAV